MLIGLVDSEPLSLGVTTVSTIENFLFLLFNAFFKCTLCSTILASQAYNIVNNFPRQQAQSALWEYGGHQASDR